MIASPPVIGSGAFAAQTSPFTLASWVHAYWAEDPDWSKPADGGNVTSWRDGGSAADNLTPPSGTPTWHANVPHLGNRAAVRFGGGTYMRTQAAGATTTGARTVVIVGNVSPQTTSTWTLCDGGRANNSLRVYTQSLTLWVLDRGSGLGATGIQHDCDPHLVIVGFNGSSTTFHVDNVPLTVASTPGAAASYGLTLMSPRDGSKKSPGHIAFAATLDGTLTSGERDDLWAWASATYQLRSE